MDLICSALFLQFMGFIQKCPIFNATSYNHQYPQPKVPDWKNSSICNSCVSLGKSLHNTRFALSWNSSHNSVIAYPKQWQRGHSCDSTSGMETFFKMPSSTVAWNGSLDQLSSISCKHSKCSRGLTCAQEIQKSDKVGFELSNLFRRPSFT